MTTYLQEILLSTEPVTAYTVEMRGYIEPGIVVRQETDLELILSKQSMSGVITSNPHYLYV